MPSIASTLTVGTLLASALQVHAAPLEKRSFTIERVRHGSGSGHGSRIRAIRRTYLRYGGTVPGIIQQHFDGSSGVLSSSSSVAPRQLDTNPDASSDDNGSDGDQSEGDGQGSSGGSQFNSASSSSTASSASQSSSAPSSNGNSGTVPNQPDLGDAEWLAPIEVGGQRMMVDFDTGSADLWLLNTQLSSIPAGNHSIYDPSKSKTYAPMTGSNFGITYGDSSSASGTVGTDTVAVGDAIVTGQVIELPTTLSGTFMEDPQMSGIFGLAFSSINSVSPQPQNTFFANIASKLSQPILAANLKANTAGSYAFGTTDSSAFTGQLTEVPVTASDGFWAFESSAYQIVSNGNSASSGTKSSSQSSSNTSTTTNSQPSSSVSATDSGSSSSNTGSSTGSSSGSGSGSGSSTHHHHRNQAQRRTLTDTAADLIDYMARLVRRQSGSGGSNSENDPWSSSDGSDGSDSSGSGSDGSGSDSSGFGGDGNGGDSSGSGSDGSGSDGSDPFSSGSGSSGSSGSGGGSSVPSIPSGGSGSGSDGGLGGGSSGASPSSSPPPTGIQTVSNAMPAVADTGTTLMLITDEAAAHYYDGIEGVRKDEENGNVFIVPCSAKLPDFHVAVGTSYFAVIPSSVIMGSPVGVIPTNSDGSQGTQFCMPGIQSIAGAGGQVQVFGDPFFKAQYVVFNLAKQTISLAPHA